MKQNKQIPIIIELKDDKILLKYFSKNIGMTVDVTEVFNFGMAVQKQLDYPTDENVQNLLDMITHR